MKKFIFICVCFCILVFCSCTTKTTKHEEFDYSIPANIQTYSKDGKIVKLAFDSHMHILEMNHIPFLYYLSFVEQNIFEESRTVMTAPDYFYKKLIYDRKHIYNFLAVVENDSGKILMMLEDDLLNKYNHYDKTNKILDKFYVDDKIYIDGEDFDYLVISPMIMDFSNSSSMPDLYYNELPEHDPFKQAYDILCGIKKYRQERPDGKLIVRPFMGVNPQYWSKEKLQKMLETHFFAWDGSVSAAFKTWDKLSSLNVDLQHPYENAFAGIKVYPPLGFDPWPDDEKEREKLDVLYSFCAKKGIPIMTHCDDQGFRVVSQDDAFLWTNPARWEKVLEKYPNLYLCIAHFGKQYYIGSRFLEGVSWQEKIIELMQKYPNVYTDMSFTGTNPEAWTDLIKLFKNYPNDVVDILSKRILFGTDWPLSLLSIESSNLYYKNFAESALSKSQKHMFISENPAHFLFH